MAGPACDNTHPAWHAMSAGDVLHHFKLDAQRGLEAAAVERSRARHGPNALPEPPPKPLWRTFARQFKSPLIYLLFVAAVLAVALGHRGDAAVILAVVLINALIGSFQEGRAERSMAALRRLAALHVRVLRDGGESIIEARDLVPGDTVLLAAGDAVDPSEYFFRTLVRFSTGHPDWLHLNKVMAIARGQRQARKVLLDLYRLT
jgi:magnesium-transporting ATPase (P-type)